MKNILILFAFFPFWSFAQTHYWYDANGNQIEKTRGAYASGLLLSNDTTIQEGSSIQLEATGGITYIWNTGATTSSIEVAPLLDIQYNVAIMDGCGLQVQDSVFVMVEHPLSDEQMALLKSFNVFPNPAKQLSSVAIQLEKSVEAELSLLTLSGRVLKKHYLSGKSVEYNEQMEGLAAGMYLWRLQINGIVWQKAFFKE